MKKIGIAAASVLAICFIAFIALKFSGRQEISDLQGDVPTSELSGRQETSDLQDDVLTSENSDRQETSDLQDDVLTSENSDGQETSDLQNHVRTSPYDEYLDVCSEEIISQSDNIKAAGDLKMTFDQKEFKVLFSISAYGAVNERKTSKLYNENGCYLSTSSATLFDVASNKTSDLIQCFIFTKDLEEAGTIRFLRNDIESMTVIVNDSESGGPSVILEKLAKEKDKKYVLLINGMETKLLDNENNIVNAGPSRHELEIEGDCYSILEQNGLSVSYSDIIDEENLIWIEFEKFN